MKIFKDDMGTLWAIRIDMGEKVEAFKCEEDGSYIDNIPHTLNRTDLYEKKD